MKMADQPQTMTPQPNSDITGVDIDIAHWELVKTDEATGIVFEVLEGGKDIPTICTKRVLGLAPDESYANNIPLQGE